MGFIYWDFIPTQQVLDLLFPSASPSFPGTWVNFHSEASHQPPGSLSLQLLLRSMWLLLGGLNLEHQAHHLLAAIEDGKSSQAEPESQADWELRFPADGNVYYALDGRVDYNFVLRETAARKWFKVKPKEFSEPSVAVASRIPAAGSSSSAVAAGPSPQATQSNEWCKRKVTSSSSSLLHSSEQVEDSRFVHVLLEGQSRRETKRILVTCQERVRSLIRRALDQNRLQHEDVDNYELLRMMSENEKIKVPDHSLMYLSMNPRIKYHFIVRKRPQVKGKEFSESSCKSSRPLSHKQVGDTCLIRVQLETQSPKLAKTVLVTCHDRAPVIIRRALELHLLDQEKPEDYELGQIISHRQSGYLAGLWHRDLITARDGVFKPNKTRALLLRIVFSISCHINRILESPRGNALLIGVGGSGKQSLTRLAAFISSMDVFQITLRKGYQIPDFKVDLAGLCLKAGVKNLSTVFLMTDAQVADERFLVLINDLLASGEIPDLYSDDEVENIINNVRNEVRSQGLVDNRDNCWKFFIDRVRRQLKVTLCFSPVGNKLRVRSRKFPAIVNCTAIDWFHEWPQQALESVSLRFLQDTETIEPTVKQSISKFMAFVHASVNQTSKSYLSNEQRYNYTTPKSFLEFIRLYQSLLCRNGKELKSKMERLENGLLKLHSTSAQVDDLKAKLATQEVELKQKNEDADKLIQVVGVETDKVSKEKAIADEEEQKVALIMLEVKQKQKDCEEDLAKAEPALTAAQAALNTLNKTNLTELKSFGSPPPAVSNVSAAVMVLMAPGGKVPKDQSWKAAKVTMTKVDSFLDSLIHFDKENIHENCLKAIRPYLQDPEFNPEFVATKSYAASGLCSWVINIVRFYEVFCDVEPKRQALSKATSELTAAQEKLAAIKAKIAHLNENLAKLTAKFEKATADKLRCQQEAEMTAGTISLANRLVGGLASENVRWAEAVQNFKQQERTLCGDILLITAFISYLGFCTKKYRQSLMDGTWRPYLNQLKVPIPVTPTLHPLRMLTDDADVAAWQNEGLPADRMSMENATILINCEHWPLMVDPQLQGIKWIKTKYGEDLRVTQIGQKGYLQTIERALETGDVVLIENLEESIDPVLGPLLGREVIKKGRFIKIGDKECEYNPKFRLILHTKLANPHYQPELQAQATLINFTVTRDGLEDQLLAAVVSMERPDLEQLKSDLTKQQNGFKITLKTLEDNLLSRLSSASGNFLGETALVENLEITKQTAAEVERKVQEARVTEVKINEAREHYRPAAAQASLLYFIMNDLSKIHPMYQFSLKAFCIVFQKAVEKAAPGDSLKERVTNLIDNITFSVYQYTTCGLFECDKLTYLAQLTFQILLMNQEISAAELDFLLRSPAQTGTPSPVEFLSHQAWGGVKVSTGSYEKVKFSSLTFLLILVPTVSTRISVFELKYGAVSLFLYTHSRLNLLSTHLGV
ncbi:dynein axonemal heavy chain 9-like [Callospermophilus lateralis]|uniref:dynein axonemal heavy chain 9-like n=1 Tax=Callospermophilus lateralis TaxID=76772 RepID=UPI00405427AE